MKPVLKKGQLVKWNDDRGFGFIKPSAQSSEVFLHISDIKRPIRRPREGDMIHYEVMSGKDGKFRACNALIQGATAPMRSSHRTKSRQISPPPTLVIEVTLLAVLPTLGSIHLALTQANLVPFILYPAMSTIAFVLYSEDKSRAKQGKWRISEGTLHLCELFGGWLGAFVAQRILRHKSRKSSYQQEFCVIVAAHLVGWVAWFLLKGR